MTNYEKYYLSYCTFCEYFTYDKCGKTCNNCKNSINGKCKCCIHAKDDEGICKYYKYKFINKED